MSTTSTSTRTHRFVVVCVGASAVSPDVVYADGHGEHEKENGAKRGSLRKGVDVLPSGLFLWRQ